MRLLSGVLVVALAALVATGCGGGDETTTPSPAATASWTGPLLVYTKQVGETQTAGRFWSTIEVVTYDIGAKQKVASFEMGGVSGYPDAVVVAGNKIVANQEHGVVTYEIDGSGSKVLRQAAPGGDVIGIGASADGRKLALTEARAATEAAKGWAETTFVIFVDVQSGREIRVVPQSAPGFEGFRGRAATVKWRDDGKGIVVGGWTYSDYYPGGVATVMLDGSVRTHQLRQYALVAPNGRFAVHGPGAPPCEDVLCDPIRKTELLLRDLDAETDIASVSSPGILSTPWEWSPSSEELLYSACSGCGTNSGQPGDERWYVLRVDGSPPEPVSDVRAIYQRWYGDRYFEFRCFGEVTRDEWCLDEEGVRQPVDIYVGDTWVDSGMDARVIGFIDR